jgi:hypothetical protein
MRGYALIQLKITEWIRDKMECLMRTTSEIDKVPLWVLYTYVRVKGNEEQKGYRR